MDTRPPRLYADVSALVRRLATAHPLTGTDRVALEYARWAADSGGGLCVRHGERLIPCPPEVWPREVRPGPRAPGSAGMDEVEPGSRVVDTSHDWLERPRLWRWIRRSRISTAVLIHDMLPIELPEYFVEGLGARHEARIRSGLQSAHAIVVNSRHTEGSLRRWAHAAGLKVPPLEVAPLGHRPFPEPAVAVSAPTSSPYFVVLGTIEARKNHLLLLHIWRHLVQRGGTPPPQLVILGRRGWECEQVVDILDRSVDLRPYVLELNDADDAQVATFLRGARALLMPSFAEGFGMPVQEALALGTPVISSSLPSVREFAGSVPEYAEPHDGARWLHLIDDYQRIDSPLRAGQLERLASFRPFSWRDHFHRVERFLGGLG